MYKSKGYEKRYPYFRSPNRIPASTSTCILMVFLSLVPSVANAQTHAGALALDLGEICPTSAVIDSTGGFAYFTIHNLETRMSSVVKVRLSDFVRVDTLTLGPDATATHHALTCSSAVIDATHGFAYFGTTVNAPTTVGRVVKVRLSDFTVAAALTLNPDEKFLTSAVIDTINGFAYFGTSTGPGIVVKIRLSDFSRVGALTLNKGENGLECAVIDTTKGFAYFGMENSRVAKIDLSTFTRVGVLQIQPIYGTIGSAVIDSSSGYAYFGTVSNPGLVAKIRLSDFTLLGVLRLTPGTPGEERLRSAIIDTARGFAYFATDIVPAKIVKMDLSTFTCVGAFALNPEDGGVRSAAIDASAGYAYFGTGSGYPPQIPGKIMKIQIGEPRQVFTTTSQPVVSTTRSFTSTPYATETASIWSSLTAPASAAVAIAVLAILGSSVVLRHRKRAVRPSPRPCQSCGFQNPPYAKSFCVKCGNRLDKV